jgi:hypothetical protein
MTFDKDHVVYAEFVHPHPVLPKVNALAGTLVAIMSIVAGFIAYQALMTAAVPFIQPDPVMGLGHPLLAYERQFGLGQHATLVDLTELFLLIVSFLMAIAVNAYFAVEAGFIVGLAVIFRAFLDWRGMGIPEDAPSNLSTPVDVIRKMLQRERYANGIGDKQMIGLFGLNVQRLSPAATDLAGRRWRSLSEWLGDVARGLIRITRALVYLALFLVLIVWVYSLDQPNASFIGTILYLGQAAGFRPSIDTILLPYACLLGAVVVLRVLDYLVISMMVPKPIWPAESLSASQRVVASTSPHLIREEFPKRMELCRTGEQPNRVYLITDEAASVSVGETGHFDITGLIEQQPLAIKNPNCAAAIFWLISGWVLVIIGLAILLLLLLPSAVRTAIDIRHLPAAIYALAPVTIWIYASIGRRLYRDGRSMVSQAEKLLDSHWFAAPAVAYRLTGTTSRSELKVGRSGSDSIETNSTISRSEFLYDLTTAMILSEAESANGTRRMVGMWNNDVSHRFLDTSLAEMNDIVSRRAAPVNIDLTNEGLRDQVDANLTIEGIRERLIQGIRVQPLGGDGEVPKFPHPDRN